MGKEVTVELDESKEIQPQPGVRCKSCGHVITSPELAIEPHEHTFRNPAGYSFHVLCYSDAPGAADLGESTTEASWFSGYAWTFALCVNCHNHLGWWYCGRNRFAGLIATRLVR